MITVTNYGPVRELRLNRPPVNALSTELISALRKAIEQAPVDGARAVVVSGPPGIFSAGLDVPLLFKCNRNEMTQLWRELYGLMKALASSSIPICAAITGHAPAGGCDCPLLRLAGGSPGDFRLGLSGRGARKTSGCECGCASWRTSFDALALRCPAAS